MKKYTDILKELRKEKGLTQAEIGKRFNMSQRMYSFYESGQREMKIEMLIKLAEILETSTDYILGITDNPRPYEKRSVKDTSKNLKTKDSLANKSTHA